MSRSDDRPQTIRGEFAGKQAVAWRLDAPAADPSLPLVVGFHGWGMDEDRFARHLRKILDGRVRVLLPRAPLPIEGRGGASWYDYDGDQERFRAELLRAEALALDLVRAVEREQGLAPRSRWVVGYSQGGYCGSWLALRNAGFFRGMAIAGARVKTEWLAAAMSIAAGAGFEALLCHGREDTTVPPEAAERSRDRLVDAGLPVELHWFDAGHSLTDGQVEAIAGWLEARIGPASG